MVGEAPGDQVVGRGGLGVHRRSHLPTLSG
jgi:hypothetical protein